jgi:hypothetical protein
MREACEMVKNRLVVFRYAVKQSVKAAAVCWLPD